MIEMQRDGSMISAVGSAGIARAIEQRTDGTTTNATPAKPTQTDGETPAILPSPAAELASYGAPISTKVEEIRAAIANGTYKVDAKAIADRMIALDLPDA
jgi:negative regulator of flagellin synthesis FlgM